MSQDKDAGVFVLQVRSDVLDDYAPLQVDNHGNLRVLNDLEINKGYINDIIDLFTDNKKLADWLTSENQYRRDTANAITERKKLCQDN